jgi:hypothetical protein
MLNDINSIIIPAGILGAGHSRSFAIGNGASWKSLVSYQFNFVATATVGNRTPTVTLTDSAGNVILVVANATAVTASQNTKLLGLANASGINLGAATNLLHVLPAPLWVPPLATLTFADTAAIDANDNLAGGIIVLN